MHTTAGAQATKRSGWGARFALTHRNVDSGGHQDIEVALHGLDLIVQAPHEGFQAVDLVLRCWKNGVGGGGCGRGGGGGDGGGLGRAVEATPAPHGSCRRVCMCVWCCACVRAHAGGHFKAGAQGSALAAETCRGRARTHRDVDGGRDQDVQVAGHGLHLSIKPKHLAGQLRGDAGRRERARRLRGAVCA